MTCVASATQVVASHICVRLPPPDALMTRAHGFRATLVMLVALSSGCDSGGGLGPSQCGLIFGCGTGPTSVPPAIRVDPRGDVGLAVGETVALTASYHDASGSAVAGVAL